MGSDSALVVFQDKKIRRLWHDGEWYFSVVDIIAILTDSSNPNNYWKVLKHRENQLVTICNQLKLISADGKYYNTDCVNTENAFRLIQSIPSPKAEPFKVWLAKVGSERVQEIENPELAQERMKELYKKKGYSREWIEKRVRGIAIRQELTGEWKERGIEKNVEFAILTNEISNATFGKSVDEYKRHKGLKRENLRDHMNDLELIFSMLGERVTTEITRNENVVGFDKCSGAAKRGGRVAGNARRDTESELGRPVVSGENYLEVPEDRKRIARKIRK